MRKFTFFLATTLLLCAFSAQNAKAFGYKSVGTNWNASNNLYLQNTFYNSTGGAENNQWYVGMFTNPSTEFNITQNDDGTGRQLYVGLSGTAATSTATVVRAVAKWNNDAGTYYGLYCNHTVVLPEGKAYVTAGGAEYEMTNTGNWQYEAIVPKTATVSVYGADVTTTTIEGQNDMNLQSNGIPATMKLSIPNVAVTAGTNAALVKVKYNLWWNQVTFEDAATITFQEATYPWGYGFWIRLNLLNGATITDPFLYLEDATSGKAYFTWEYAAANRGDWTRTYNAEGNYWQFTLPNTIQQYNYGSLFGLTATEIFAATGIKFYVGSDEYSTKATAPNNTWALRTPVTTTEAVAVLPVSPKICPTENTLGTINIAMPFTVQYATTNAAVTDIRFRGIYNWGWDVNLAGRMFSPVSSNNGLYVWEYVVSDYAVLTGVSAATLETAANNLVIDNNGAYFHELGVRVDDNRNLAFRYDIEYNLNINATLAQVVISPENSTVSTFAGTKQLSAVTKNEEGITFVDAAITYVWEILETTANTINRSTGLFTANETGTFTIKCTATQGDVDVFTTTQITVNRSLDNFVTITDNQHACFPFNYGIDITVTIANNTITNPFLYIEDSRTGKSNQTWEYCTANPTHYINGVPTATTYTFRVQCTEANYATFFGLTQFERMCIQGINAYIGYDGCESKDDAILYPLCIRHDLDIDYSGNNALTNINSLAAAFMEATPLTEGKINVGQPFKVKYVTANPNITTPYFRGFYGYTNMWDNYTDRPLQLVETATIPSTTLFNGHIVQEKTVRLYELTVTNFLLSSANFGGNLTALQTFADEVTNRATGIALTGNGVNANLERAYPLTYTAIVEEPVPTLVNIAFDYGFLKYGINDNAHFTVTVLDQFGNAINDATISYEVSAGNNPADGYTGTYICSEAGNAITFTASAVRGATSAAPATTEVTLKVLPYPILNTNDWQATAAAELTTPNNIAENPQYAIDNNYNSLFVAKGIDGGGNDALNGLAANTHLNDYLIIDLDEGNGGNIFYSLGMIECSWEAANPSGYKVYARALETDSWTEIASQTGLPAQQNIYYRAETDRSVKVRFIKIGDITSATAYGIKLREFKAWGSSFDLYTGINEPTENKLVVFPNPATDELRIKNYELRIGETLQIFDVTGKIIYNSQFIINNSINVSGLNKGVYFIKVGENVVKFIKK